VPPRGADADDDAVTRGLWTRAALLAALLAAGGVLALTVDLPDVDAVRPWLAGRGPAGWAAVCLGVGLVLLAPVPRSVVSVLLGVVAGFWAGSAVAFAGGLLAALVAFALSRGLGRPVVERLAGRRLARVDRLLVDRGFLAVLGGRLVPVMPFVVLSYGAGLTPIRPAAYAGATALGLVPSTVVQVGVGASAGALVAGTSTTTTLLALTAALVAVVAAAWMWRSRRRAAGAAPLEASAG
jgi:uncharacterized membrane protein YdjX (TVP38/TMEM64 family)